MTRGGGKALVFGGPFVTGGGATARTVLDLASFGTFTRSSYATYITGAATDGSSAFMVDAGVDVRRFEDRGDGNGAMLLMEGPSTNMLAYSEVLSVSWSNPSGSTVTQNYGAAPDGTATADRIQAASGATGVNQNVVGVTAGADFVGTHYSKAPSGTASYETLLGFIAVGAVGGTQGTTWNRYEIQRLPNEANTTIGMYIGDGRDVSGSGGTTAGARDMLAWGMQLEQFQFATSYIRTPALTSVTRSQDVLTAPIASAPAEIINGSFTFTVAPVFSSAGGVRYATDQCLFSFAEDDSERIFFVVSGGSIYLRVTSGGATKVTSNALTFSAHQKLTVTVNGVAGSITVAGATAGNGTVTGTSWTRTTGPTVYVANRQGATKPAYVRLGRFAYAA